MKSPTVMETCPNCGIPKKGGIFCSAECMEHFESVTKTETKPKDIFETELEVCSVVYYELRNLPRDSQLRILTWIKAALTKDNKDKGVGVF